MALALFCALLQVGSNVVIDFLFDDLLSAALARDVGVTKSVTVTARRLSTAIRSSSNKVAVSDRPVTPEAKVHPIYDDSAHGKSRKGSEFGCFMFSSTAREYPVELIALHGRVSTSLAALRRGFLGPHNTRYDVTSAQNCTVFGTTIENADVARSYEMLQERISMQRGCLNEVERRAFDAEWRYTFPLY